MKLYIFIILSLLLITSCENPEKTNGNSELAEIIILSPQNNSELTDEIIKIEVQINNKDLAKAAYILINDNIIGSGLSDTLIAYYEPEVNLNQNITINAILVDDQNLTIDSDNINLSIITTDDFNSLASETVFMDVNTFKMMRFPVTNRQFLEFLNTNNQLTIETVDIIWSDQPDVGIPGYGHPDSCEFDNEDNYEPTEWWYVSVSSNFANENIPAGNHVVYRNGYNIYDTNADFSNQGGQIKYGCENEEFYIDEALLDHPVVGVTWVGANIYANYFGWSIPDREQWKLAARGDSLSWIYPWGNEISEAYANYKKDPDGTSTTPVGTYNGTNGLNLSLSSYGLYDMAGNVWEHTLTPGDSPEFYYKTGGAFTSEEEYKLEVNYQVPELFNDLHKNTGFRCIADINYPTSSIIGCTDSTACNFDSFANENSGNCVLPEEFFQDLDNDGLGNPNVMELNCENPEEGWVSNSNDSDDNCYSSDENEDNIDCSGECDGEAYFDGCGECVGGNTGNEPCLDDCHGDEGGDAFWDDCNNCVGGNTGLEENYAQDCNEDCDGNAFIDGCGYCVGGNTGLEENYADVGCGCDELEAEYYCEDLDGNGCCDCGNNDNGDWDECSVDTDAELICADDLLDSYINLILGCSNSNAQNYYCDEDVNECITFGANTIPPCNFIDDGTCIVWGCSDPDADNYNEEATECEDGTLDNCCEYIEPVIISFGSIGEISMEILINTPHDLLGFQFDILGTNLGNASGGIAADNGFTVSTGGSTILGFSFSGDIIPSGSNGILTNVEYTATASEACLDLGSGAISDGNGDSVPVEFGECHEF